MKKPLKIFIIIIIPILILCLYIILNYKEDYIECSYDAKELSYGKVLKEYPTITSVICIDHLFKKVYSPDDISIDGHLVTDTKNLYEIEKTLKVDKGYGIDKDHIIETRIIIDRIMGTYNDFTKIKYYENGMHINTIEVQSSGYCKAIEPKF